MAVSLIFLIMSLIFLIMMITEATLVIMVSIDPSMAGRELSGGTVALQRPQQHRTSRKVPQQRAASFAPVFSSAEVQQLEVRSLNCLCSVTGLESRFLNCDPGCRPWAWASAMRSACLSSLGHLSCHVMSLLPSPECAQVKILSQLKRWISTLRCTHKACVRICFHTVWFAYFAVGQSWEPFIFFRIFRSKVGPCSIPTWKVEQCFTTMRTCAGPNFFEMLWMFVVRLIPNGIKWYQMVKLCHMTGLRRFDLIMRLRQAAMVLRGNPLVEKCDLDDIWWYDKWQNLHSKRLTAAKQ